jgi:hypothetical protein
MQQLNENKLSDFEKSLKQAVEEAKAGEGVVHSPEQILAWRQAISGVARSGPIMEWEREIQEEANKKLGQTIILAALFTCFFWLLWGALIPVIFSWVVLGVFTGYLVVHAALIRETRVIYLKRAGIWAAAIAAAYGGMWGMWGERIVYVILAVPIIAIIALLFVALSKRRRK